MRMYLECKKTSPFPKTGGKVLSVILMFCGRQQLRISRKIGQIIGHMIPYKKAIRLEAPKPLDGKIGF